MTTRDSYHQYDIGVKGQCQVHLNSVLHLISQTALSFLIGVGVFMFSTMIAFGMYITKYFRSPL